MINLLPLDEKEALILEKRKKLTIVVGNVFLISLLCLVMVLLSLKFYILSEVSYQKSVIDTAEKKYQTADFLSFKDKIQKYNAALLRADNFYKNEAYFSDALKAILDIQRPQGISFSDMSLEKTQDGNGIKVSIAGKSDTRDELLIFKDSIEKNTFSSSQGKKIQNVDFPPDNWVKPNDVSFYFTFEIH